LRGYKGQVYEGGIRIPFAMQWKGHLPMGRKVQQPIIALDVVPTALAAAGGAPAAEDKLDGVNLLPFLKGEAEKPPHDRLFWRMGQQHAARVGDWKLIATGDSGPWELYDLAKDRCEQQDLAGAQPDRVRQLAAAWQKHDDEFTRVREESPATTKQLMPK